MSIKKIYSIIYIVVCFGILGTEQLAFGEASYVLPVNLMVAKGEVVRLPDEVLYIDTMGNVEKDQVIWEDIADSTFQKVGNHKVNGWLMNNACTITGTIHVYSNNKTISISVLGDSITQLTAGNLTSYPAQLEKRLGSRYKVSNFGISGHTLSQKSYLPYKGSNVYKESKHTDLDALVIQLGTNDSWEENWVQRKAKTTFKDEYVSLIKEYKAMNSDVLIYLCLPPETTQKSYIAEVRAEIVKVAKEFEQDEHVTLIDNYTVTKNLAKGYMPDGLHPSSKGVSLLSQNIYHYIHGLPFSSLSGAVSSQAFTHSSPIVAFGTKDQNGFYLDQISHGDWVSFANVDLLKNSGKIALTLAKSEMNKKMADAIEVELRLDRLDGLVIATGKMNQNMKWQEMIINNSFVSGFHKVYVLFKHPQSDPFEPLVKFKRIDFNYYTDTPNNGTPYFKMNNSENFFSNKNF